MIALVIYVGAAFGLAYIVGHSKISYPFRNWLGKRGALGAWLALLLECVACFGWWTGFVIGFTGNSPVREWWPFMPGSPWVHAIVLGLFTSGVNFLLGQRSGLTQ